MNAHAERLAAETLCQESFSSLVGYVYAILDEHPAEIPFGEIELTADQAEGFDIHLGLFQLGLLWIYQLGGRVEIPVDTPDTWVRHERN